MVHQTIKSNSTKAPAASNNNKLMNRILCTFCYAAIVGMLAACGSSPVRAPVSSRPVGTVAPAAMDDSPSLPSPLLQARSRWTPVAWSDLPGLADDPLHEAWNAWLKSCERPGSVFAPLCGDVRRLSIGSLEEQRSWLMARLQPYRVEALAGDSVNLLTGYYEPVLEASRSPSAQFPVPLFQPPLNQAQRKPWYTRQEIDTLEAAQAALKGREIAYLADPVDALVLQIQGSGRVRITEPNGSQRLVRLSYAGSNEQPYKSVGRWLVDQGELRDASWPAIRTWLAQNPSRVKELLWSNPRTVFFREELLTDQDSAWGPKGAQGVPLTPGRSIAVDPGSIPYGTPVWLVTSGPALNLQKLVLAQDTGTAIVGALRADYFAGSGPAAGELAGRLKQTLHLWVLWPK